MNEIIYLQRFRGALCPFEAYEHLKNEKEDHEYYKIGFCELSSFHGDFGDYMDIFVYGKETDPEPHYIVSLWTYSSAVVTFYCVGDAEYFDCISMFMEFGKNYVTILKKTRDMDSQDKVQENVVSVVKEFADDCRVELTNARK
ncbi:hypothetical protein LCGC14_0456720 [marine sediment metagenome]|uniref:Uncharacterized protein n=1 Tax=marine sediment metagenome TaxID=412755 RepID=A0A0F9SG91_9ZZZZ|nr:hypothetical protein [Candidatus Aminicenantes bacterium]